MSYEVTIRTSARKTLSFALAGLRDYFGSQPKSKQMTSHDRELERLLNACEICHPSPADFFLEIQHPSMDLLLEIKSLAMANRRSELRKIAELAVPKVSRPNDGTP